MKRENEIQEKAKVLAPLHAELSDSLTEIGFTVTLHTNPNHLPCSAIHVRHKTNVCYDYFGEIGQFNNGENLYY